MLFFLLLVVVPLSRCNFYNRDDLWRWKDGIIPYQFHETKIFDQDYKGRIEKIIEDINLNLLDCALQAAIVVSRR